MNSDSHFSCRALLHAKPLEEQLRQEGFVSSHLILRERHVWQPERVRRWMGFGFPGGLFLGMRMDSDWLGNERDEIDCRYEEGKSESQYATVKCENKSGG